MFHLVLEGERPPSGNDFWAGKTTRYTRSEHAREAHFLVKVALADKEIPIFVFPVLLVFRIYESGRMRDWYNYHVKAYEDGLVEAGILPDDSHKYVRGGIILSYVDKDNPRLEIEVYDVVDLQSGKNFPTL